VRLGAGRSQDREGAAQLHGDWVGGEADVGGGRFDVVEVLINVSPDELRAPFCRPRCHRLYPPPPCPLLPPPLTSYAPGLGSGISVSPVMSMLVFSARPAGVTGVGPREGRFSIGAWCLVWEAREPHGQSGLETEEVCCEGPVLGVVAVLRGVAVMQ
jgi:hypothetical protein